MFESKVSR